MRYADDFCVFWTAFCKASPSPKGTKKEAYLAWAELQSKDELPPLQELLDGIVRHSNNDRYFKSKGQFVPSWKHGCRWLRNECWDTVDELEAERERRRAQIEAEDEKRRQRIEAERQQKLAAMEAPSLNFKDFLKQRMAQ